MLTGFQNSFIADLAINFWQSNNCMSHHTSMASLHYLVKCLCSKIAVPQSWVKRTRSRTYDSAIQNSREVKHNRVAKYSDFW